METLIRLASLYGLGVVLAIVNVVVLIKLIFRVLDESKTAREQYFNLVNNEMLTVANNLNRVTHTLIQHNENMQEAFKRLREEHDEMLKRLTHV